MAITRSVGEPAALSFLPSSSHKSPLLISASYRRQKDYRASTRAEERESSTRSPAESRELAELEEALKAANAAIGKAESSIEEIAGLPSSQLSNEAHPLLRAGKILLGTATALAAVISSHAFGWPYRIAFGCSAGLALGLYGHRKGSLSKSGSVAAVLVGAATLSASARAALVLLAFYLTSSKLTTYCEDRKLEDEDFKKGGQRDWKQVLCNGLVPSVLALAAASASGGIDLPLYGRARGESFTGLAAAFLGYFCCCCGDTWASEVGQLSSEQPRLITSLRPVRKGTNGGVTRLGLLASSAGGLCIGLTFYLGGLASPAIFRHPTLFKQAVRQWIVIPFGLAAGLAGSAIDSLLGATVQYTGYNRATGKVTSRPSSDVTRISGISLLDNNAVNLASASIVAALSAAAAFGMQGSTLLTGVA